MQHTTTTTWSTGQKLAFRFFSVYFFIYVFYSAGIIAQLTFLLSPLVSLAGKILKVKYEYISETGSGDTTYDYLLLFCFFWLSLFATILWSILDRKRTSYNKLLYWTMVMMRYSLGMIMMGYGSAKIFYSQFSAPGPTDLVEPFGEFSPMGLAWRFMGYSYAFNLYTGLAEALGGFLLFFRRTTTFGSLFCMTVLSTVVAMNFCYDIPVKLFSSHLLLMAVFIAAPEIKRITTFFFTNKDVPRSTAPALVFGKKINYVRIGAKVLVIGGYLALLIIEGYSGMYEYGAFAPKSKYEGIYEVKYYIRNNDTIAPMLTDSTRWQQLVVESDYATIKYTSNKKQYVEFKVDTIKKQIELKNYNSEDKLVVNYSEPVKGGIQLAWKKDMDSIAVMCTKKGAKDYLLSNRGFHWINEYPYNR